MFGSLVRQDCLLYSVFSLTFLYDVRVPAVKY